MSKKLPLGKLTPIGYKINADDYPDSFIKKIHKELHIIPATNEKAVPVRAFLKKNNYYYLPRVWAEDNIGVTEESLIDDYQEIEAKWNKKEYPLFDRQKDILNAAMPILYDRGYGRLSAGCGAGKTGMSIYMACKFKTATLIVCPRIEVCNMWMDEIPKFTDSPKAKAARLIGEDGWKSIMKNNPDFVVTTMHTFSMYTWPIEFIKRFGMVIYDECQYMFAREFSNVFNKILPKYALGLSATAVRKDRLDILGSWFLGGSLYHDTFQYKNDVRVLIPEIMPYVKEPGSRYGENITIIEKGTKKPIVSAYENTQAVVENNVRNRMIIDWVNEMASGVRTFLTKEPKDMFKDVKKDYEVMSLKQSKMFALNQVQNQNTGSAVTNFPTRVVKYKILVITNRVAHLEQLQRMMNEKNPNISTGIVRGQMKAEETRIAKTKQVIFGIISCVKDAFSVSDIDCVVLATSVKNEVIENELDESSEIMQQIFGRCMRKEHNHLVFFLYVADEYTFFKSHKRAFLEYCQRNKLITVYKRKITHVDQKFPIFSTTTNNFPFLPDLTDQQHSSDEDEKIIAAQKKAKKRAKEKLKKDAKRAEKYKGQIITAFDSVTDSGSEFDDKSDGDL